MKTFSDLLVSSAAVTCVVTFVVAFLGASSGRAVALGAVVGVISLAVQATKENIS